MTTRPMKRVETIDQTMSTNVFSKTHLFLVNFIFVTFVTLSELRLMALGRMKEKHAQQSVQA